MLNLAVLFLLSALDTSQAVEYGPILVPVLLGATAVYLLLPRVRPYPPLWGASAAGLALISAGWLVLRVGSVTVESLLFYAFSAIAVIAGGLLITQRNPARAALSFALVVLSTCGLFLLQAAPFLMAATIVIYAGAIVVTFLFVLMLAQQEGPSDADQRSRGPALATVAGFVLLAAVLCLLQMTYNARELDDLIRETDRALANTRNLETSANNADATTTVDSVAVLLDRYFDFLKKQEAATAQAPYTSDRLTQLRFAVSNVREPLAGIRGRMERKDTVQWQELIAQLDALRSTSLIVRNTQGMLPSHEPEPRRDGHGRPVLPAENVASLGRSLFTDYLLAVELGGTLLLIATIGAIAIAQKRTERAS